MQGRSLSRTERTFYQQSLLASSDSVGAADEQLAQLMEELGSLAGELRRSAEELQDLNTSLNDNLQDTKAVERRCACVCVCGKRRGGVWAGESVRAWRAKAMRRWRWEG